MNEVQKRKKVLVVDDSKSYQKLISGLLESIGLEVCLVANGSDALKWLNENPQADMIVLDICMPDKSGLEVCRYIREEMKMTSIPIVFCSGQKSPYDEFWALRQGGNAYITKPYSPKDFVKKIKEYL